MVDQQSRKLHETRHFDDDELFKRCGAGEVRALHELVIRVLPTMKLRIQRVVRQRCTLHRNASQDASDILQHAACILIARGSKALDRWNPTLGLSLCNFAGLFAERVALSWLRSGRLSGWAELPVAPRSLEKDLSGRYWNRVEHRDLLRKTWQRLSRRLDQATLRLFKATVIDEEPVSQICRQFKLTPNAVYCAKRRFRQLAQSLQSQDQAG